MSCHYKCQKNNFAFLIYKVLHRDSLNNEFVDNYLFCSYKCMQRFKKEYT